MVVNTVVDIGRKRVAPLAPMRQIVQPANMRPRARVVNVSKEEMRHHEAVMEARHAAQSVRKDLQSAANALSAANAENDRLSRRVKDLEAENAKLRRGLENANRERQAPSNALDELKKLSARVKDLEAENARICKELEGKKQECLALSKALEGLKSETSPKTAAVLPEGNPVQPAPGPAAELEQSETAPVAPAPAKRRRKKNKRNEAETPVQTADGVVQQ